MLVLPRDGQSLDDARTEMETEIDDPLTTVLVARGDDDRTLAFVERAEMVAEGAPRRRVVHLLDPAVLSAEQEAEWFADVDGDPVIGAVLNNLNGRCGRVLRKRPSRLNIEMEGYLPCERVIGIG